MDYAGYLDHNATSPIRPEALAEVTAALTMTANPSSVHRFGRDIRGRLEAARERVAALVGAEPAQVVFTSGGTEANGLALRGCGRPRVLVAATEHLSVLQAIERTEQIPVDGQGLLDLVALDALLEADPTPAVVSVMLANNETGVMQPVAEVAARARRRGALVHCDAVQAAGKVPVDVTALGVNLMTISGHKIGGPAGSGALIVRDGVPISAEMRGGGQERRRRAGTENVAGIVGFGAAAAVAASELGGAVRLTSLRDDMERQIAAITPTARVFARNAPRLPNTTCVTMPDVAGDVQLMTFDLAGIAVSTGAACSSGKVGRSHVLTAMGAGEREAGTAIRVSLGWTTTVADVERFVECWAALYRRTRARRAAAA